jgi:hypothetical protein
MAYALTASTGLLRSRDLFLHDGAKLRRIRLSAPVQAAFFLAMLLLVGWCAYATAQLAARKPVAVTRVAAAPGANLEERARLIEQRQAVIEAMLVGEQVDPALLSAAAKSAALAAGSPLNRLEAAQVKQAAMVAQALEARYELTAEELRKLGLTPARVGATGVGGPYEPAKSADPTFKALFNSGRHRQHRRLAQRRVRQPRQARARPRHRDPLCPPVRHPGPARPAGKARRHHRPHGLHRPLHRLPPAL